MAPTKKDDLATIVRTAGGRFSTELGIRLRSRDSEEIFKWFLASILFGARISSSLAARTYREFEKEGLVSAAKISARGWDGLVAVLDEGGYARYDFKTATKLLEISNNLTRLYGGDLNRLHRAAIDAADLEAKLKALGKGIGDVTVNIFLRELRGIWEKAEPLPMPLVVAAAKEQGLVPKELADRRQALAILRERWEAERSRSLDFADFEAALVRLGLSGRKKAKPALVRASGRRRMTGTHPA